LATTATLFGSMLCPLLGCGILLEGRWLWWGSSRRRGPILRDTGLVTVVGAAFPVAAVGCVAIGVSGASWDAVGVVAAIVVVVSCAALVAGSLVPWRDKGVGDQLTTLAALAAIVIAASLAVGIAGPQLVSRGLPDVVVVALLCALSICAAACALAHRLGTAHG
jgi:hypothetical protein